MGGAEDLPHRSSSPMKRRASDLEHDELNLQKDVEMLNSDPEVQDSSVSHDAEPTSSSSTEGRPSIDEQIETVKAMCETAASTELVSGTTTYLVSKRWLARVQIRASGAKAKLEDLEGDVGPVDNSDIIQEVIPCEGGFGFARLLPDLPSDSFEYFPEEAWEYVIGLYGLKEGQSPIIRKAHNTNPGAVGIPNMQYELNPPVFTIHRLWSLHSPVPLPQLLKATDPKAPVIVMSRSDPYVELLRKMKKVAEIEVSKKVRVWKVPLSLPAGGTLLASNGLVDNATTMELSPPNSRSNTPAPDSALDPQKSWRGLLVDVETFLKLEKGVKRQLVDIPDHSSNLNYNGHASLDMAGIGADQSLVLDELVEGSDYLAQYVPKLSKSVPINVPKSAGNMSKTTINSGRSSPALSGPVTRGRNQRSGRTLGTVGLSNLGNTCYMNSALQCVRSVEELTKYFLIDEASKELNRDNPLGNNGEVAMSYSHLLHDIYKDPVPSSVTPRYFKQTIGRYAPAFSGYGQQDSQEFLGFLLDGLQEDLSRIKKKPYIEKPDSTDEMVNNPEAIREMAAKVWDITKKRDDSVIADLFTGMYKSTLVCPICAKVSITFDPFNNLTLQLPVENSWSRKIRFFPLGGRPMIIEVDMDKNGSIKSLKDFISKRVKVPIEKLFLAEDFKSRFYKFFEDYKTVSEEIQGGDDIAIYELEAPPTNWPAPRKPRKQKVRSMVNFGNNGLDDDIPSWDDPMSERMLVPVYHRRLKQDKLRNKKWEHVPVPHFIVITPTEARNEDIIRRKILEFVGNLTTHPAFAVDTSDEEANNENVDSDLIVTNVSDADSSGDGKVMATSVDSEDDVIDVTMKDSNSRPEQVEKANNAASSNKERPDSKLAQRRPHWADPNEHLSPEFQNLFEMQYYSSAKELVPVGWNAVDEDKEYPRLSTRRRSEGFEETQESSSEFNEDVDLEASSSEAEIDNAEKMPQTRMNDESSDEDELVSSTSNPRVLPVRPGAPRPVVKVGHAGRRIRMRTHLKKVSKSASQAQHIEYSSNDVADNGPLIRLGEGIVVDWNPLAWDTMFAGDRNEPMRGMPTYTHMEILEDPDLDAKRKARVNRRKKGLTLDECLDEFGKEEILSEMDTWYCPRCKEHRRASKKFELWKTPDILVMHLKRFSSNGMRRDKLDIEVDFPIEGLDLTSRVMEQEEGKAEVYDLFAVDDHWGGLGGGHYTAFAKSFIDGEWYEYNDSSVSKQRDTSRIVSHGAYLLFYRRRSNVPLGGSRFKDIVERYDNPPEPSEDESESGEGQRLDADSSLRGSSSALIGAGAARQASGSGGIMAMARNSEGQRTFAEPRIDVQSLDRLPPYQEAIQEDDGAPLLARDAVMNDGLGLDEGIDMGDSAINYDSFDSAPAPHSIYANNWSFSNLQGAGATSKIALPSDADSDAVQHDSSASEGSLKDRLDDFDNAEVDTDWVPPSPIPDADDESRMDLFGAHVNVPAETTEHDGDDGEVAEINVEEGEGLKVE